MELVRQRWQLLLVPSWWALECRWLPGPEPAQKLLLLAQTPLHQRWLSVRLLFRLLFRLLP
jgi:hypothetical protein